MIGYLSFSTKNKSLVMVSLSDGMVVDESTEEEFVDLLNKGNYMPIELLPKKDRTNAQ